MDKSRESGLVCTVCAKELDDNEKHNFYDCLEYIKKMNADLHAQLALVVAERDDFLVESGIWRVKAESAQAEVERLRVYLEGYGYFKDNDK